jgi:hypothetical protein
MKVGSLRCGSSMRDKRHVGSGRQRTQTKAHQSAAAMEPRRIGGTKAALTMLLRQGRVVCGRGDMTLEALLLRAAVRARRSEGRLRAQSVSSVFSLHALAAQNIPQLQNHLCRHAAEKPAIHARRSKTNPSNSQTAGQNGLF